MDAAVELLIDKNNVSETVRRYFLALDRFDWPTVASYVGDTFTLEADAPGAVPQAISRDEFMKSVIDRNGGFTGTLHINSDHVVDVDGDTAHVAAHMWAAHAVGQAAEDWFWGFGIYDIDLERRTDGGWRLVRQSIQLVGAGGPGNPAEVFARSMARQQAGDGHY